MNLRILVTAVLAVAVASCAAPTPTPAAPPTAQALTAPQHATTATQALELLAVRDADPVGYRRELFGASWADVDHNRCDTRSDVLRRDLTNPQPATGCLVQAGLLHDPYTGATVAYLRGRANRVQIDHVVSLGDAWRSGANTWTAERRTLYANYPPNLLATAGTVNESKGDDTAADWQPPDPAFGCRFAAIVVNTKTTFGLTVTQPERDALTRLLQPCPDQPMRGAP